MTCWTCNDRPGKPRMPETGNVTAHVYCRLCWDKRTRKPVKKRPKVEDEN